jgi:hypothetical protein
MFQAERLKEETSNQNKARFTIWQGHHVKFIFFQPYYIRPSHNLYLKQPDPEVHLKANFKEDKKFPEFSHIEKKYIFLQTNFFRKFLPSFSNP